MSKYSAEVGLVLQGDVAGSVKVKLYIPMSEFQDILAAAELAEIGTAFGDGPLSPEFADCTLVLDVNVRYENLVQCNSYVLLTLGDYKVNVYKGTQHQLQRLAVGLYEDNKLETGVKAFDVVDADRFDPDARERTAEIIERYIKLDRALRPLLLANESPPLILAGHRYLTALYRQINTYPLLLSQGISGRIDRAGPEALRKLSLRIMSQASER